MEINFLLNLDGGMNMDIRSLRVLPEQSKTYSGEYDVACETPKSRIRVRGGATCRGCAAMCKRSVRDPQNVNTASREGAARRAGVGGVKLAGEINYKACHGDAKSSQKHTVSTWDAVLGAAALERCLGERGNSKLDDFCPAPPPRVANMLGICRKRTGDTKKP
ncbi:hypothetical protein C8J57DRAFT_1361388 [Mycena rebaudengoi]|nr:hypothetical protein C8J57DRAFT_1361388 [Mycena rebaudengoi]